MAAIIDFSDKFLDGITEIEKVCFARPWTKEQIQFYGKDNNSIFKIAVKGEIVAGYGIFLIAGKDAEILRIAVLPQFRRGHCALALMEDFIGYAKAQKLENIFLEVRPSNKEAINLYSLLNFNLINARKNYYGDEDALILRKIVCE